LKTDGGLEMPSKISLLKDLANAFLGKFSVIGHYGWSVSIVKEPEVLIAVYRTANVVSYMLSEQKCWVKLKMGPWRNGE
jgi:hypothetical protein